MERLLPYLLPGPMLDGAHISVTEDALQVLDARGNLAVTVDAYMGDLGRWSVGDFVGVPVYMPFQAERQYSTLRFDGGSDTLGYLFPTATLRKGSEVTGNDNRYLALFAAAGTRLLLADETAKLRCEPSPSELVTERDLESLFPEFAGIAVLSRELLEAASQDRHCVGIGLLRKGCVPLALSQEPSVGRHRFTHEGLIKVGQVSADLKADAEGLLRLLASYASEPRATSRFLGFYQVLEYLLSRVFDCEIQKAIADPVLRANSWDLREYVAEVARERWRLVQIAQKYCRGLDGHVLTACRTTSTDFLVANGEPAEKWDRVDWAKALYTVRGTVVHRQLGMTQEATDALDDVCHELQEFCCEVICRYREAVV